MDLPSGADPAGEVALGDAVFADETVTFGVAKPVHLLPATEPAVGRLTVVDIGLALGLRPLSRFQPEVVPSFWRFRPSKLGKTSGWKVNSVRPVVERLTFDDVRRLWPVPEPARTSTRGA